MNLNKKALFLSYFTVIYNIIEGIVSIVAGFFAGSKALVGFGIDSFIESFSGSIMIWRFRKGGNLTTEQEEKIEKRSIKLVAYTFFILGGYVIYESAKSLLYADIPERSMVGIIILVLSLIIMPFLAYQKYQTGKRLESKSLMADAKQTFFCIILSITTLIGIGLNYFWGLWQADPIAGLIIGLYLWKEGYEAFQGDID